MLVFYYQLMSSYRDSNVRWQSKKLTSKVGDEVTGAGVGLGVCGAGVGKGVAVYYQAEAV
jgi:hypothetical protein